MSFTRKCTGEWLCLSRGPRIINFYDETTMLHKDVNAQHYKVLNLEAMAAAFEGNVKNAMDRLPPMELKWKQRVESLDY